MTKTENTYLPDWKEKVDIGRLGTNVTEVLPRFEQLIKNRDIEGIQKFYQEICTNTIDFNDDRDPYFHRFLMQFSNMSSCDNVMEERKEPKSKNHYLSFKCIYHRDEDDEFSVITFFKKQDLFQEDYRYQCFLMYNNLVGMETYLHTYEFKEPVFDEKYMIQCNNLVLSFKLEGTKHEELLFPAVHYNEDWVTFIYDKLQELGLTARNILINGEDLTVVVDLWRSITLKSSSLKYILQKVEDQLLLRLQDYNIYNNEHFFMVPGSINSRKKISISKKTKLMFANKRVEENVLVKQEDGYYRCYYAGMEYYPFPAVSLTTLAEKVGFPKPEKITADPNKQKRVENKKKYTHVGMERLEDLDKLIEMRQDEIRERFNFFRILGNILFYLGKEDAELLKYMDKRNKRLYESISENCLLRIFTFCKEDYEKYLSDPALGIKYTNSKIVELLQIKPYEQQEMKQLIDDNEAEYRIRISHIISTRKAYDPVKQKNQVTKDILRQELLQLKQNGLSNNEIAKQKKFDLRKVDKLIGKISKKELEQQVKDMTASGRTAAEISEALSISISTVRRIRTKIK